VNDVEYARWKPSFDEAVGEEDAVGVFSDGLRTAVLPARRAYGMDHKGIMNGKLDGLMIKQTPFGHVCRQH
jgi:hypothetical protein